MTSTDALHLTAVDLAVANNDPAALDRIAAQLDADDHARRHRLEQPGALAEAATWYCAQGVPLFPLVPGEKRPIVKRGLHEATTDPGQVKVWWDKWPQANIAFRTGVLFDVIDVDGPPGYRSLAGLRDDGLVPAVLGRASTARGGSHLYIDPTGDGNTAGLRPGIDYRGNGGYVVAPPSLSVVTGRRWTWTTPPGFSASRA